MVRNGCVVRHICRRPLEGDLRKFLYVSGKKANSIIAFRQMMEFETRKQMIQELKNQAVMEFRQYKKNTTDVAP